MAAVRRMAAADPFAEHAALMKDLYHEYARRERDDLEQLATVRALLQEASSTAANRQQRVQDVISGICSSISELEALSTYPESEGMHDKRVTALQAQVQDAQGTTTKLQQELKQLEDRKQALATKAQAVAEKRAAVDKATAAEETLLRHQLSLFAHISKVSWRLDRLETDDHISGTVSDPKSGDLRPFDIDPRAMDAHSVVNSLWQLL